MTWSLVIGLVVGFWLLWRAGERYWDGGGRYSGLMKLSPVLNPPAQAPVEQAPAPEVLAPKTAWERLMEDEQCG